jgi:hypothetical protein
LTTQLAVAADAAADRGNLDPVFFAPAIVLRTKTSMIDC